MTLNNDIALVTGASRGIGRAIAETLAQAGATVVGTATTPEGAAAITAWLQASGWKGHGAVFNAADPASVDALMADMGEHEGLPTILVNNAGIARDALLLRLKNDDWDETLDINLGSVFRLSRACLKRMLKERRGRIINISSVVGAIGNAGQAHYSAAKAGLIGLTKSMARELSSRNITVNAVAPGFIETDMTRALNETQRQAYQAQIPLGRFGAVEDIAHAVLFLASQEAGYVTGQTLHVNGGMYMN
ncbi:MAG: 3-oxoacyl-ACP reductase FabG [Steroidobacteraceae bacterium]